MVGPWITFVSLGAVDLGDLEFLRDKELAGDLIHLLSSEFTGNADQITFIPASGKTFFHVRSKLYPVVNTIAGSLGAGATVNRRADVELTFDTVLKDVLTFDMESVSGANGGSAASAGQPETNIFESMVGNGVKAIKLTSTNNSGTYRVSMLGWIQNT